MKIQPVCAGIITKLRSAKKPSYKLALQLIKKSQLARVLSTPQMKHLARGLADGKMNKAEVQRVYERHAAKIKHGRKIVTIPGEKTKIGAAAREFMKLTKYTKEQNATWRKFQETGSLIGIPIGFAPKGSCPANFGSFMIGGRVVCLDFGYRSSKGYGLSKGFRFSGKLFLHKSSWLQINPSFSWPTK